jgi:GrpB-like predicted nucleotidyltransferase (UPF0157 family)
LQVFAASAMLSDRSSDDTHAVESPVNAYQVVIEEHSIEWAGLFTQLGQLLRGALGPVARRIDHIGSTAIPGLAAKPIIDVQISVSHLVPEDDFRAPLEEVGFLWRSDNPDLTKRYFREASGHRRTHIHVRQSGSWPEQFALLFRDYLRTNELDRRLYEATKRTLAAKHRDDRHAYTNGKDPVIWEIMRRATRWTQETGWLPQASDA